MRVVGYFWFFGFFLCLWMTSDRLQCSHEKLHFTHMCVWFWFAKKKNRNRWRQWTINSINVLWTRNPTPTALFVFIHETAPRAMHLLFISLLGQLSWKCLLERSLNRKREKVAGTFFGSHRVTVNWEVEAKWKCVLDEKKVRKLWKSSWLASIMFDFHVTILLWLSEWISHKCNLMLSFQSCFKFNLQ